jgi:hypothetical protein
MRASRVFEQQIHRVHELLDGSGAVVTWNDHIPDPDNPQQMRQIDVTIRRGTHLTLVECRLHQSPQDVNWIEELMGRRRSLVADAVIAVSSSGFTAGALSKAQRYGVITRDLYDLTEAEVKSWGQSVALTLFFYQYSDLELSLLFARESVDKIDAEKVKSELTSYSGIQSLFNAAADVVGQELRPCDEHQGQSAKFRVRVELEGFRLCGEPVVEVDFCGTAQLVSQCVASPSVRAYGSPGTNPERREATIEHFSLGDTAIVHEQNRVSVLIDISQVEMPPLRQFRFARLQAQDEVEHEVFELVGVEMLRVRTGRMRVNLAVACGA